jgi:hypothetical protein
MVGRDDLGMKEDGAVINARMGLINLGRISPGSRKTLSLRAT